MGPLGAYGLVSIDEPLSVSSLAPCPSRSTARRQRKEDCLECHSHSGRERQNTLVVPQDSVSVAIGASEALRGS